MTYETAEAIIKSSPQHAVTVALIRLVAARAYLSDADRQVVAELVVSALALAYTEGHRHAEAIQ